jgi:hypothetical protein
MPQEEVCGASAEEAVPDAGEVLTAEDAFTANGLIAAARAARPVLFFMKVRLDCGIVENFGQFIKL